MKVGVVFPQTESVDDPGALREYAQAAEDLGYEHIGAYEHVLGADPGGRDTPWTGYTYRDRFHEPFALFSYFAGITTKLSFLTAVVVLPQRQAVLVAKQAAQLDVLSRGRFRLGVGIGWNAVEYEALDMKFRNRARRYEEQIAVMRALWKDEIVAFRGRYHSIDRAGLNPMPVQRPIPVWMGGKADAALARIARIGDGLLGFGENDAAGRRTLEKFRAMVADAGRDPATFPIQCGVSAKGDPGEWVARALAFQELGCSHVYLNTMGSGRDWNGHLAAMRAFRDAAPELFS